MNYRFAGLNLWARDFVKSAKAEWSGDIYFDAIGKAHPLYKYILSDGKVCFENDACFGFESQMDFLYLKDEDEKPIQESVWTREEYQRLSELPV